MRVISQDGTLDFSYEMSTIFIYGSIENVVAIQPVGDSQLSIIGRYSSKEKAIKAMEMLRKAYAGMPKLNVDEIPNLRPEGFGEKLRTGDILLCNKTNADVSFSSNCYFQFPQDDEIEV